MESSELHSLFYPKTVCVIGASKDRNKVGSQVLTSILAGKFEGGIFPINPRRETLFGLEVYKSMKDINAEIDLAFITIPNSKVPMTLEECREMNFKFVVIITAGFGEMVDYNPLGPELKREILQILKKGEMRVVGPNCMGVVSTQSHLVGLMGIGIPPTRKKINVSIVSQSGTWMVTTMRSGHSHGLGVSKCVSSGNELDLKFEDYLEYFGLQDPDTQIILGFIEGLRQGKRFIKLIKEINKPIILLKGGKTHSGTGAAKSHTGSIAGSQQLYEAVFKQHGIIEANNMSELVDYARALGLFLSYDPPKLPKGSRVGIYSGGGGACVLLADNAEREGLTLPQLDSATIEKLDQILPTYWSHSNPVDLVATWNLGSYSRVLTILLEDPNIDSVIARPPLGFSLMYESKEVVEFIKKTPISTINLPVDLIQSFDLSIARDMGRIARKSSKPVIIPFGVYSAESPKEYEIVQEIYKKGILVASTAQSAARILKKLAEYQKYYQRKDKVLRKFTKNKSDTS